MVSQALASVGSLAHTPFTAGIDEVDDSPLAWQENSLCAQTDPEAFFPEKGGSTREAKKVCAECTVRTQCLEYAMSNDERFGIWGGLSERERRKLKRQRRELAGDSVIDMAGTPFDFDADDFDEFDDMEEAA